VRSENAQLRENDSELAALQGELERLRKVEAIRPNSSDCASGKRGPSPSCYACAEWAGSPGARMQKAEEMRAQLARQAVRPHQPDHRRDGDAMKRAFATGFHERPGLFRIRCRLAVSGTTGPPPVAQARFIASPIAPVIGLVPASLACRASCARISSASAFARRATRHSAQA